MNLEILNATFDGSDFPRHVKFRPAYSGGVMYADGITIPEPLTVDGEDYPAGTRLPVVVDLSSVILEDNIPIFYNHDSMLRLGHTESVISDGKTLIADGLLDSPNQWAKEVVESFKAGAKWQCSVGSGLIDIKDKRLVKSDESINVNGQTLSGPFTLLSNLRVREISIVPAGADPNTETLLASLQKGENAMTFEEFMVSKGFNPETLTDENKTALEALFNESQQPEDLNASEGEEEQPEEKKEETVEASEGESEPTEEKKEETVEASEGESETTEEEEKKETMTAGLKTGRSLNIPRSSASYQPRNQKSGTTPTKSEVLQASALLNLNIPAEWLEKEGGYSKRTIDMALSKKKDVSLLSLMGEQLQASGIKVDYRNPHAIVNNFKDVLNASGISTKSFGNINIFSPIIDKQMRYKYERIDSIWKKLLKQRTVKDFNKVATVDFDVIGQAKDLNENEDYPTVELKSSGAEFAVKKQGVTAAISFESQINDDLGALDGISEALVYMVSDVQVDKFWSLFWSKNSTIFTTAKGNKITKVLGIDGLGIARKAFGSMKNANGRFLHVPPTELLVPLALADKAEELFKWQWAGESNTRGNINVGRYAVETDPYLGSEGGYTGATDTGWFMIGDTSRYPIGEYAYLSGYESPGIKETWYDHKDALNMRALGTIGFYLYEENIPMVYSTGTAS